MKASLLWIIVIGLILVGGYVLFSRPETISAPSSTPETGQTTTASPSPLGAVTVKLAEQGGSGQSGTARLEEDADGKLVVTLALSGGSFPSPQPAHIHVGACPNPGAVKYPLTNVVGGASVTTLDTTWAELEAMGGALAVNVHKSAAESKVYTACGNLPIVDAGRMESKSTETAY